jgi:short-subunit dehydrogenase
MNKQVALITGASKGIGLELAKCFARDGYDLILVARNNDELARAAEEIARANSASKSYIVASDLSQAESADEIQRAVQQHNLTVDVLVNNAGFGLRQLFAQSPPETLIEMLSVNVVSLTRLSRLFLPGMIERKRGGIMNVASIAGFFPGPMMAVYYATKAYVISLSEALANEVSGSGVKISCLCPGPTTTHFQKRAEAERMKLFTMSPVQTAAAVAEEGYRAFQRGQLIVITGLSNKFAVAAGKMAPRGIAAGFTRMMSEP